MVSQRALVVWVITLLTAERRITEKIERSIDLFTEILYSLSTSKNNISLIQLISC